eukprot:CAMPEP_0175077980 /NCGR_PEP_ID=MMETSP0052_2-20121109/23789_1 /TAXON_ID=51329 ORGANISM="Polytomella parva, Strain SAG 63-3" /NCGR_SAMPLE_ID=MMETSP0052_2 /ASSEMBLY_ACC=CAM_ASM_000194 /LENGTH=58 /DNA_ID=CAMNT_0016347701 /DNA_START=42 /DNA_END=218 /DNA_ORIENTATION=+
MGSRNVSSRGISTSGHAPTSDDRQWTAVRRKPSCRTRQTPQSKASKEGSAVDAVAARG